MNQGRSAPQLLRAKQVSREQECEREYEALQRNHRSKFGDDDTAREAAGSAAMLRAKELTKSGNAWRKAAKRMPRKLIGMRERVHTFGSARKDFPKRPVEPVQVVCARKRTGGTCRYAPQAAGLGGRSQRTRTSGRRRPVGGRGRYLRRITLTGSN